jgi:hypothetical protein
MEVDNMIYLVNNIRVLSTLNWEQRNPEKTIEEFAKENNYKIVDIVHDEKKPISKDDFVNGVFKKDLYEKRNGITEAKQELKKINTWFQTHDWIPNKIITGEWNIEDERWIEYLSERQLKRLKQDELNKTIGE